MAKNFFAHLANFSSQIFIQFFYFIIISRFLGAGGYGIFASLTFISILGTFVVGFGCETTMIKNVAVDRSKFRENLGHCLTSSAVTLPLVSAVVVPVALWLYLPHMSWQAVILIVFADLLFTKLFHTANGSFMATDRAGFMLFLATGAAATRMAALGLAAWTSPELTLEIWAVWYLAGQAFWAAVSVATTFLVLGPPKLYMAPREWPLGLQFTVDQGSQIGFKDMDKPAVLQAVGPEATGVYTAAFRLAEAANTPLRALLYAVYTRFFKLAGEGRARSVAFGFKVVPIALVLAGVIGAGIFIVAGFVPLILGEEYAPVVGYLRMLAAYPLLNALTMIGVDILRATGRQPTRLVIMLSSALVVIPACFAAAQAFGVAGAVIARIVIQGAAAAAAWLFVALGQRADRAQADASAASV